MLMVGLLLLLVPVSYRWPFASKMNPLHSYLCLQVCFWAPRLMLLLWQILWTLSEGELHTNSGGRLFPRPQSPHVKMGVMTPVSLTLCHLAHIGISLF